MLIIRMNKYCIVGTCIYTDLASITFLSIKLDKSLYGVNIQGPGRAGINTFGVLLLQADVGPELPVPFRLFNPQICLPGIEHLPPCAGADKQADLTTHTPVCIKGDMFHGEFRFLRS